MYNLELYNDTAEFYTPMNFLHKAGLKNSKDGQLEADLG
jgi:hypothetical protein